MGRLDGKTALVTGATAGLGREIATVFAREGAKVICTGRNQEKGAEVAATLRSEYGEAEYIPQDVSSEGDWQRVMDEVAARYGRLDILVNNAGTLIVKPIEQIALSEWQALWRVNVDGCFLGTQYGLRFMKDNGGAGSIINVSSLAALIGLEDALPYCASKAAVTQLSKIAAIEGAADGRRIRVNSLNPGVIWSDMIVNTYGDSPEVRAFVMEGNALQELGYPDDVSSGALYLASDASRHVTGTVLLIDGGRGAD